MVYFTAESSSRSTSRPHTSERILQLCEIPDGFNPSPYLHILREVGRVFNAPYKSAEWRDRWRVSRLLCCGGRLERFGITSDDQIALYLAYMVQHDLVEFRYLHRDDIAMIFEEVAPVETSVPSLATCGPVDILRYLLQRDEGPVPADPSAGMKGVPEELLAVSRTLYPSDLPATVRQDISTILLSNSCCTIEQKGYLEKSGEDLAVHAELLVTSKLDGGRTVVLPLRLAESDGKELRYFLVSFTRLKNQLRRLFRRLSQFGLFKTITLRPARGKRPTTTAVLGRLVLAADGEHVAKTANGHLILFDAHHNELADGERYFGLSTLDNRRDVIEPKERGPHRAEHRTDRRHHYGETSRKRAARPVKRKSREKARRYPERSACSL